MRAEIQSRRSFGRFRPRRRRRCPRPGPCSTSCAGPTARFAERGLATPRLDAELLVAHVLSLPRVQLYVQFERVLTPEELAALRDADQAAAGGRVGRLPDRAQGVLEVRVRGRRARAGAPPRHRDADRGGAGAPGRSGRGGDRPPRIADVGTGSGALAITLAKLRADAAVFASDVSAAALEVARANAERLGAAVTFVEGDLAAPLAAHAPFSLIVANLPYIPTGELAVAARRRPQRARAGARRRRRRARSGAAPGRRRARAARAGRRARAGDRRRPGRGDARAAAGAPASPTCRRGRISPASNASSRG